MAEQSAVVNFLSEPATLVGLGVLAVGTAYYMATRPQPTKLSIPRDCQSIELAVSLHTFKCTRASLQIRLISFCRVECVSRSM